jgi:aryl-alcohol dehydrogenase-like predicted oxidoreductase
MKKNNPNIIRTKLEKELDIITEISLKSNLSIGSIALNYCLMQNNIAGVLIGVDSLKQLKENIAYLENKISNQYVNEIEMINIQNCDLLNPSLWNSFG